MLCIFSQKQSYYFLNAPRISLYTIMSMIYHGTRSVSVRFERHARAGEGRVHRVDAAGGVCGGVRDHVAGADLRREQPGVRGHAGRDAQARLLAHVRPIQLGRVGQECACACARLAYTYCTCLPH